MNGISMEIARAITKIMADIDCMFNYAQLKKNRGTIS
jgi:hypothetical protein